MHLQIRLRLRSCVPESRGSCTQKYAVVFKSAMANFLITSIRNSHRNSIKSVKLVTDQLC